MTYKQHYEIIDSMKSKYDNFSAAAELHGMDLQAIWDNHKEPAEMLEMLRESNYSEHYYQELVEFLRWLWSEQRINGDNVGDVDQWLSNITTANETQLKGQALIPGQSHGSLWEIVWMKARESVRQLIQSARGETQKKQDIVEKLRNLIPTPFLPKVP